MKKRILSMLLAGLLLLLAACGTTGSESSGSLSEGSVSESEISEPEESVPEPEPIDRTWPHVTGTFLQPGAFVNFSVSNWRTHFNNLLEAGIDTLIIQWTSETPYYKFKSCYYPSQYLEGNKTSDYFNGEGLLEKCLQAAEESGIKVFIGLNLSDEWWSIACTNVDWNQKQSNLGIKMAKEMYELYKEKYPNAFYGWYFAWEMYNGMQGREQLAGEFLNMYLDPLTGIDPDMPLLLSPFVSKGNGTAEKAGQEWTKVFEVANFRDGDIFCCQDAVGAGHIGIEDLDAYFKELKKACDTEAGLKFWANSENFTQSDWTSAYIDRFVRQMKIAQPYVEGYVTFAYSHYYAKDYGSKGAYHRAYKLYYDTGMETAFELEKPTVTYENGHIKINLKNSPAGLEYFKLTAPVTQTKTFNINELDSEEFDLSYSYTPESTKFTCKIEIKDYFGNTAEFDIEVNTADQ